MSIDDKDHARVSVCALDPVTGVARDTLVTWLLGKLEVERYAEAPEHSDSENARRRGWNARAESLEQELRVRIGLAELAACDVDGLEGG